MVRSTNFSFKDVYEALRNGQVFVLSVFTANRPNITAEAIFWESLNAKLLECCHTEYFC